MPSPSGSVKDFSLGTPSDRDMAELALMATIRSHAEEAAVIPWSLIAEATVRDKSFSHILNLLETQGSIDSSDPALARLSPVCRSIYSQDSILMYNDRVVVPESLRRNVLQHLHSAHQGVSTMKQRARAIVYWPGMSKDIQETRNRCAECNRNAPSPCTPPSTPFDEIFVDFFDYGGHHYLIVGDRLSGWVEVLSSTSGTNLGGSAGLVRHLRKFFATSGVPEEL